jgi:hypothetical protein
MSLKMTPTIKIIIIGSHHPVSVYPIRNKIITSIVNQVNQRLVQLVLEILIIKMQLMPQLGDRAN